MENKFSRNIVDNFFFLSKDQFIRLISTDAFFATYVSAHMILKRKKRCVIMSYGFNVRMRQATCVEMSGTIKLSCKLAKPNTRPQEPLSLICNEPRPRDQETTGSGDEKEQHFANCLMTFIALVCK